MADSNAHSFSTTENLTISAATDISSGTLDNPSDDICSICLEPFDCKEPAIITGCKHEYHLHCILEWLNRSDECPLCLQELVMEDPTCQKLLIGLKKQRCSISTSYIDEEDGDQQESMGMGNTLFNLFFGCFSAFSFYDLDRFS